MNVLEYPHSGLKKAAGAVTEFGQDLKDLVADMVRTMQAKDGIGLSATQVGDARRVFIVDGESAGQHGLMVQVFVNPVIVETSKATKVSLEGCLSFPGVTVKVERHKTVKVKAQNMDGDDFEIEAAGLFAVVCQHEIDHLDGITMVDRLGPVSREMFKKKHAKQRRALR